MQRDNRPLHVDLHDVAEAQDRILQRLAVTPEGTTLAQLLPDPPDRAEHEERRALRWRSAWASTFSASPTLARQGR